MGVIIARQPNGLLCRWSTVVDNITHYNMTEEEYLQMRLKKEKELVLDTIENGLSDFSEIEKKLNFYWREMGQLTKKEIDKLLKEMSKEVQPKESPSSISISVSNEILKKLDPTIVYEVRDFEGRLCICCPDAC